MPISNLENKPSATTFTTENRPSVTSFDLQEKTGTGYQYDEPNMTYDEAIDPDTGLPVNYDAVGIATSWSLEAKPS